MVYDDRTQPITTNRQITDYLAMSSSYYKWMRHALGLDVSTKKDAPLIDNEGLSLEEGNDLA